MNFYEEMESHIPQGTTRTRFAPSPTGYMHVGNLRTALYTWLIARHNKGTFILRIEDTDQGRLVEGAVDVIYKTMAECGLTHDEGPDVGGPTGPYIQTERRGFYGKYAELLVEKGGAYYCFCEKTESEEDSGDFNRAAEGNDGSEVLGASALCAFLRAAADVGLNAQTVFDVQSADALGGVDLVPGEGRHVHHGIAEIFFQKALYSVGMKRSVNAASFENGCHFF